MLLDDVAGNGDDKQANLVGLRIQANLNLGASVAPLEPVGFGLFFQKYRQMDP
jgi:hypothetical protein